MPDVPEEAVQAAAELLYRDYDSEYGADHLSWRDFADQARKLLEAAAPILAAHVRRQTLRDVAEGRVTLDEQAAAQGHTKPQRIEDLHTDLELTPEEMEAFIGSLDEPDCDAVTRADERRKVAEEIAARITGTPKPGEAYWRVWAARIAREAGEAHDAR